MPVNLDKPHLWKDDIAASVDLYNEWFMAFAPQAFRDTRIRTTEAVERAFEWTNNLTGVSTNVITAHPDMLAMLRMCTCPPLARDRLIGLANLSSSLVWCMEVKNSIPSRMKPDALVAQLNKARDKILKLVDPDIFVWLGRKEPATTDEVHRAATIIADRLCGSQTDPIIRNAQEQRQLRMIGEWLNERSYQYLPPGSSYTMSSLPVGSYSFRLNAPVKQGEDGKLVNLPIDVVIKPHNGKPTDLPLLIECKSAGDFTNTNKRRKEEATKINQLRATYGKDTRYILFLCGYFDSGYLGYEAAEGIDWVWEHRIDDLAQFAI